MTNTLVDGVVLEILAAGSSVVTFDNLARENLAAGSGIVNFDDTVREILGAQVTTAYVNGLVREILVLLPSQIPYPSPFMAQLRHRLIR